MTTRPKTNPRTTTPSHNISLSDGTFTYGLILDNGVKGIQEQPQTPSTLQINAQGGQFGDFDPSQSHIQQSNWVGGRASEKFTDDNTRYFDGKNLWSLNDSIVMPSLQWKFGKGTRNQEILQLGNNYEWKSMAFNSYSNRWTASASYTVSRIYFWVKKVGAPGTLTVELRSEGTGAGPGTVIKTITNTGSTLERNVIYNLPFIIAGGQAITSGTVYNVVIYGADDDSPANHWEVMAGDNAASTVKSFTSRDKTTWYATSYRIYYRVTDADATRRLIYFQYKGSLYAVTVPGTGTSQLYVVADVTDADEISSGATKTFTEVTTTGLTVVTDVLVSNGTVYFAQGESVNIRRWNGTTWADDGTNKATFLYNYIDPATGPLVWRANVTTATISRSVVKDWGTNLAFGASIKIGENTNPITGLCGYNDALWVFKEDSVWAVRSLKASKLDIGIDDAINTVNGRASTAHGLFLYFSFVSSLEQLYGSTLSDVGPGHGAGLPTDRTGSVSDLNSVMSHLFVAIDGYSTNYSSVLIFDGINYHEIWRGPEKGKRIRNIYWQPGVDGSSPYLWIDYAGDPVYIKFPKFGFNVQRDANLYYAPNAQLVTSTFDMNATRLPKIFKEITAITKNLSVSLNKTGYLRSTKITSSSRIGVDYQCDDDIGTDNWTYAGDLLVSPSDTVPVNEDHRYAIRFRFRFQVSDAATPPAILATVLEGMARTPVKYQWVIRAKVSSMQSTLNGATDHNPDKLIKWLVEKSRRAEKLMMHSSLATMDGIEVISEPPSVMRDFYDPTIKSWGGNVIIVLREA